MIEQASGPGCLDKACPFSYLYRIHLVTDSYNLNEQDKSWNCISISPLPGKK